jgi:hypothetical protein
MPRLPRRVSHELVNGYGGNLCARDFRERSRGRNLASEKAGATGKRLPGKQREIGSETLKLRGGAARKKGPLEGPSTTLRTFGAPTLRRKREESFGFAQDKWGTRKRKRRRAGPSRQPGSCCAKGRSATFKPRTALPPFAQNAKNPSAALRTSGRYEDRKGTRKIKCGAAGRRDA